MAHLQGPVPLADGSYIERQFERDALRELMGNRWVLLLGPRQHGKTSGILRIRRTLADEGISVAIVDLQAIPPFDHYEQLVGWFCRQVFLQLHPAQPNQSYDGNNLAEIIGQVLPDGAGPIVIIVDEASSIRDNGWRNSFYGQLRSLSNRRAEAGALDPASRLRFLFAGTFKPETLIDEANSPFNVCQRCDSEDLSSDQSKALISGIVGDGHDAVADLIFGEVGGQPFLIQEILSRVGDSVEVSVQQEIDRLRLGNSHHVEHLFGKILSDPKLAAIVSTMIREGSAPIEPGDADFRYLQVLGIAKRVTNRLHFRNNLYQHIATSSPQLGGQNAAQPRAPMFYVPIAGFIKVVDDQLREIAWSAHHGAVASYLAGSNRLALAGFGASLEAILLDLVRRHPPADLPRVTGAARCRFQGREVANNPDTWNLVNLIKVGPQVGGGRAIDPPQALREWRNLIHASVALQAYRTDDQLEAEARTAASMREIVLRDLP